MRRDFLHEYFKSHCTSRNSSIFSITSSRIHSYFSCLKGDIDRRSDYSRSSMSPFKLGPFIPLPQPVPHKSIICILNFECGDPLFFKVCAALYDNFPNKFRFPQIHFDPVLSHTDSPGWLQIRRPAITVHYVSAIWILKVFHSCFVSYAGWFPIVTWEFGGCTHWEPF